MKKLYNIQFVLTLALLMIVSCAVENPIPTPDNSSTPPSDIYPDSDVIISTHTAFTRLHYPQRIEEFREDPLEDNDIVLLGNSITEQGGEWALRLNNSKARNRGIAGDTTEGVLARLGEIIYFKPKQVFILIGINDLFLNSITPDYVFNNIVEIVNQIHEGSPDTIIYLQTILPTNNEYLIEKIQITNQMLIDAEASNPYEIISLHKLFTTEHNLINMEFSTDGVHLNENGYSVWVNNIINLVNN